MNTGAECRTRAAEFLVLAKREPRTRGSLDRYGRILASPRDQRRADTNPHGPRAAHYSPKSKLGRSLIQRRMEMEAPLPSLDQLRENAAECIRLAEAARTSSHRSFFIEMAERWLTLAEYAAKTQ